MHTHRSGCIGCVKAFGKAIRLESVPAISNAPPRGSGGAWSPDDLVLQRSLPLVVPQQILLEPSSRAGKYSAGSELWCSTHSV